MKKQSVDAILKQRGGIRLDIACGQQHQDGFVGMDIRPGPGVDIIHDINIHPWPLPDESVTMAIASHIVEHIPPVIVDLARGTWFPFLEFMDECWRVMIPDGQLAIATPHGYSPGYLQDPTHCNPCYESTFLYFDPLENSSNGMLYSVYRPKPWKLKTLNWSPEGNIEVVMIKRLDDRSYHA
jgi:hypothetical protein